MSVATARALLHTERVVALKRFPGLSHIHPELAAVYARHLRERFYLQGETLFEEGREVTQPLLLVDGQVGIFRRGRRINTMGSHESVGFIASFAHDPEGITAVAEEDSYAFEFSREDLLGILEEHFEALHNTIRLASRTIIGLRQSLGPNAGFSPTDREPFPVHGNLSILERIQFLRQTFMIAFSRIEVLGELARESSHQTYSAGDILWREGDRSSFADLILTGQVQMTSAAGQEFTFGPGDAVGSIDAMAEIPRWFTATAVSPVHTLRLESETLLDVFEDSVDIGLAMVQALSAAANDLLQRRPRPEPMPALSSSSR